ncbi:hypothetical protein COCMIDRAFT_111281, partial [Bipolaris oryzae ATCC 44560]
NPPTSTGHKSTTMATIDKAFAAIASQGLEGESAYFAAIENFGVEVSTLTRRHHAQHDSCTTASFVAHIG